LAEFAAQLNTRIPHLNPSAAATGVWLAAEVALRRTLRLKEKPIGLPPTQPDIGSEQHRIDGLLAGVYRHAALKRIGPHFIEENHTHVHGL